MYYILVPWWIVCANQWNATGLLYCPVRDYWYQLNKHLKSFMTSSTLDNVIKGGY